MLYPLKFEPVYKNILWGGRNIEKNLNRIIPKGNIAESWDICCRDDGMSIVSNGILKGRTLNDIVGQYKEKLLGTNIYNASYDSFPLLIKIIDANDRLSVQVHPDDEYARENGSDSGKTEMWYIIDAKPGAKLVYGLKEGVTKEEFIKSIYDDTTQNLLNSVSVNPGDVFYIPSGTIHAILDGILLAEIQQNSNTTYRVYDWNRVGSDGKGRELHIDKALDVIDFDNRFIHDIHNDVHILDSYNSKTLSKGKYFTVEEINIESEYKDTADGSRFHIYMNMYGESTVYYSDGCESLLRGQTLFIPACLGEYKISGRVKLLKIYI